MINSEKMNKDSFYMNEALKEAKKAYKIGEVPVGCVIVLDDTIIARAYNTREKSQNAVSHAELLAIQKACKKVHSWRLEEASIYVTLEPCPMCAGAMLQSRIKRLVYATKEPKSGVHESILDLFSFPFNHSIEVISGVGEEESRQLLKSFFKEIRNQKDLKS